MSYCDFVKNITKEKDLVHKDYHDNHYGFPIEDDNELFGRLVLEINQAGLSWTTILNKQANFRQAYHNFNIEKVAAFTEKDFERLMQDAGIIRNRLKIRAAIENARRIQQLQQAYGSLRNWLDQHHPKTREAWTKLFKETFLFTGSEIVNEFLMSIGMLEGAHDKNCSVYKKLRKHH